MKDNEFKNKKYHVTTNFLIFSEVIFHLRYVGKKKNEVFLAEKFLIVIALPVSVTVSVEINKRHYFQSNVLALSKGVIVFPVPVVVSV